MTDFLIHLLQLILVGFLVFLHKRKAREHFERNHIGKETSKYVPGGIWTLARMLQMTVQTSRDNSPSPDTIYNKLSQEFGCSKPGNVKKPFLFTFFNVSILYPRDYTSVKELLCSDLCVDKVSKKICEIYSRGPGKGLMMNNGETWKELRKYTIKKLGQLGFGKNDKMCAIFGDQVPDLMDYFESLIKSEKIGIQVKNLFTVPILNVIWCIVGGSKFSNSDEKLHVIVDTIEELTNINVWKFLLLDNLPTFLLGGPDLFGFKGMFQCIDILNEYFMGFIEDKEVQLEEKKEAEDFVDHFLSEIEKHKWNPELNKIYNKEQLSVVLFDLFSAGMDTTSKFMESAIMFMVLNPDIQIKVQHEIDSVIGNNSLPLYCQYRKSMPFTLATLMEIHRMGNVVPMMPRMTNRDWTTGNMFLKKGTWVTNNFFYLRMDEKFWGDPHVFRPQRFLDSENNLLVHKINHVMPFGAGTRVCLGESVASSTTFTFFTALLQRYSIHNADASQPLRLHKGFVFISHPEPFRIDLIRRVHN